MPEPIVATPMSSSMNMVRLLTQKHLEWTPERMQHWGASIGPKTGAMIDAVIKSVPHVDQAYRKCLGLLRLAKFCGHDRLELACDKALTLQAIGYRSVKNILDKGMEAADIPEPEEASLPLFHDNVRARADGSYGKLLTRFAKYSVLIIDDWGLAKFNDKERRDIFLNSSKIDTTSRQRLSPARYRWINGTTA